MSASNPNLPTPAELLLLVLEGKPQAEILAWAMEEMPEKIKRDGLIFLAGFSRESWQFYPKGVGGYLANRIGSQEGVWFKYDDNLTPADDFVSLADLIEWRRHNPRPAEGGE